MSQTVGRSTNVAYETTYTAGDGTTSHNYTATSQRTYFGPVAYIVGSALGALTMSYLSLTTSIAAGGDWALTISDSTVAAQEGGDIDMTAGKGNTTGTGGDITLTAGQGGATAAGGDLVFTAGAGGATSGTGGAVTLYAGAGTNGNADGGALTLRAGNAHGSGTDGILTIGDANTSALQIGATGILTTFPGAVTVTQALTGNVTGNASGSSGTCTGNAGSATYASATTITDDTTTAATMYPLWVTGNTGNLATKVTTTKLSFRPDTGILTATGFAGDLTGNVTGNASGSSGTCTGNAGSATYAAAVTVTDDTASAGTMYPAWFAATTGNIAPYVASSKLSFVPSTGILTATGFAGNLTGNVTGDTSGSSGTCTGNAATATSAGTVTGYVDGVAFNWGTGADITQTYDGTDNVLDVALGTAAMSFNITATATDTCTEGMAVQLNSTTVKDGDVDVFDCAGICRVGAAAAQTANIAVSGTAFGIADGIVTINRPLKVCSGGRLGEMLDSVTADSTIKTVAAGAAFTNQPANDSITFVSSDAADTQDLIMYGTTNGTDTVVVETKALNGVGAVVSTKLDWGEMLGFELSAPATGTITITETSGGLGITTIAPAAASVGVETVAAGAAARAFNGIPTIESDDATTKQIGVVGTGTDYSALTNNSKNLNGTTPVSLGTAMNTVTKVLVGDLEAGRSVEVNTQASFDDAELRIARSLGAAAAKDAPIRVLIEKGI